MATSAFRDVQIQSRQPINYSVIDNGSLFPDDRGHNNASGMYTQDLPSATALHIGAVVMLFALLWGLFGNILTSCVILTNRDLKSTTNIFIVSLCINDILNLGINNMFVLVSYFMMEWKMGLAICELVMHFTVLLMGSSLWHTGLISIHRLIVVCFNNFYKKISKKAYTIFVLSFARIIPLLFIITPHLGRMSQFQPKLIRCLARKEFKVYTMLVSITLQMVPSIILIVCYIAIFVKVFRSSSAIRATRKREWLRRELQVTKMFGMVFLLIILGYLPYGIVRFIDRKIELSADFYVVISVVYAVANSCNPIIYGVMDRKIRRYCFRALGLEKSCMKTDGQAKNKLSLKTTLQDEPPTETAAMSTPAKSIVPASNTPPPCQGYQFTLRLEASVTDDLPRVIQRFDDVNSTRFVEGESHHGLLFVQSVTRVVTSPHGYSPDECRLVPLVSMMFTIQDTPSLEKLVKDKDTKAKKWMQETLSVSHRLAQEVTQHDDTVVVDMVDVYRNLPSKLLLCHRWLFNNYRPRFVMKTDDDVYVNVTNVVSGLSGMDARKALWWGSFRSDWRVDRHGKWQEDEYTDDVYPDFACGSGNVVSAPVHQLLMRDMDSFKMFQGEDVSMGIWLSPFDVTYIHDSRWRCDKTCSRDFMALPQLDPNSVHWYRNNSLVCPNPCEEC